MRFPRDMRHGRVQNVAFLAVLLLEAPLWAAPLPGGLSGYSSRVWHTQDGLPEDTIQALAQTRDGYLWIGTSGGLVRFDGVRFTVFSRENTPAFRENSVSALLTSKSGDLWIGTQGGGAQGVSLLDRGE